MRQVVIDANVLISWVFLRDEAQQILADELFVRARTGELSIALPQFVIFESLYVFRSFYRFSPGVVIQMLRDAMAMPGIIMVDYCPWSQVFEHWSDLKPSVGDAAILALAIANHYDLATFDHKLANRAKTFGVAPYW